MIVTGILLLPTVVPHAIKDLRDMKTVIDSTTATINAAPDNASWGFFNPAAPEGSMGTADLITNITTTVLRAQYLLNVDKVAWTMYPNSTNSTAGIVPTTPTTPSDQASPPPSPNVPIPTALPTPTPPTPSPSVITNVDDNYLDYINSIPDLASALTKLGRSWHKELNKPVWDSIDALQQGITSFSSSLLAADLVHGTVLLRTIRAGSSLEDAQVAWSRLLNIPGGGGNVTAKRSISESGKASGRFYTHEELWDRREGEKTKSEHAVLGTQRDTARHFVA